MKILEVEKLSVEFSGFKAISDLDFTLDEGEIRTIIGPNGAGKTTFIDLITGKIPPTKGKIKLKGKEITNFNSTQISKLGVGRKFQGPNIFDSLTVLENIDVALKGNKGVFRSIFYKNKNEAKDLIEDILEKIGLIDRKDDSAEILSHGQKQWLEIGMILAQDPDFIILDEPTTGMTADETFKTGELIQTIFKNRTVIVVEHDMAFVKQIAQKVTVLHQGKLLAEGSLQSVEENEEVQKVYLRGV